MGDVKTERIIPTNPVNRIPRALPTCGDLSETARMANPAGRDGDIYTGPYSMPNSIPHEPGKTV